MMRWSLGACVVCLSLSAATAASAQVATSPSPPSNPGQQTPGQPGQAAPAAPAPAPAGPQRESFRDRVRGSSDQQEVTKDYIRWIGNVELPLDAQTTLSADRIEFVFDTNILVAQGNVAFASNEGRITAERIEYNVEAGTGTFIDAYGIMSLGAQADRKQFGNQDADVYFFGEKIEKVAARKYRIFRGGFSTCTQPTPRWQMTSHSLVLNLDDYAFARDTVLRVKGVPIMYLPVIYYPIQDSQRQTGFLLPTYGQSTIRGQGLSNAFFWAIGRSQDATFFHDWYTRAGQGEGMEYRYIASPRSNGNMRFYRFAQSQATYTNNGQVSTVDSGTSYEITANLAQTIWRGLRARGRVEYFTSLLNQQLYHQNIYDASRNRRAIDLGLTGNFGPISTSALYQRQELFSSSTTSTVYGSTPRVTASLSPQRLFHAPIYVSGNSEYAVLPSQIVTNGTVTSDSGYNRLDVTPTVRVPLSRLTFLSVNTSATYRTTYYSRSATTTSVISDQPYTRQYTSMRSDIVGPVFTRIWDLKSGFAERLKHVIEPAFTFDFTSQVSNYKSTPQTTNDVSDFVVSGNTRVTYGLTNRLFYRGRSTGEMKGQTREFVTVGIQQTYYTNPESSLYDTTYQTTSFGVGRPVDLSPVTLSARVSPTGVFDANSKLEYDVWGRGLTALSAGGTMNLPTTSMNLSYSHSRTTSSRGDYVNAGTQLRWLDGRANLNYSLSWDIAQSYVQSQHVLVSYLAQCCGLQLELQKYNYLRGSGVPLSSDMRFNFGFVLAGLGTFSNFFGAFGGPR
jgi:LPS-assembly protein